MRNIEDSFYYDKHVPTHMHTLHSRDGELGAPAINIQHLESFYFLIPLKHITTNVSGVKYNIPTRRMKLLFMESSYILGNVEHNSNYMILINNLSMNSS